MAQVSSNVADAGAKLARQVSAPVTNLAKKLAPPKQAKTTPEELDRRKREQELQKRDRTLDGMQDNEGFEARRKLRGGTRE
jgi:hypothetical protein